MEIGNRRGSTGDLPTLKSSKKSKQQREEFVIRSPRKDDIVVPSELASPTSPQSFDHSKLKKANDAILPADQLDDDIYLEARSKQASLVDNDFLASKDEQNGAPKVSRRFSLPASLDKVTSAFMRRKSVKAIEDEKAAEEAMSSIRDDTPFYIKTLMKDAIAGWTEAQFSLGYCYDVGAGGVKPDTEEAIHWYSMAGNKGHAISQNNLGVLYSTGHRGKVKKDWAEALHWYMKAGKQGNPNAQFHAGLAYMNGEGVEEKDDALAFQWYKKAAKQGHVLAQSNVGAMYLGGRGVAKNYKKAVKWLRKAAQKGDGVAMHNLGVMYLKGFGVIQDSILGEEYIKMSNSGRNAGAIPKELSQSVIKNGGALYNS